MDLEMERYMRLLQYCWETGIDDTKLVDKIWECYEKNDIFGYSSFLVIDYKRFIDNTDCVYSMCKLMLNYIKYDFRPEYSEYFVEVLYDCVRKLNSESFEKLSNCKFLFEFIDYSMMYLESNRSKGKNVVGCMEYLNRLIYKLQTSKTVGYNVADFTMSDIEDICSDSTVGKMGAAELLDNFEKLSDENKITALKLLSSSKKAYLIDMLNTEILIDFCVENEESRGVISIWDLVRKKGIIHNTTMSVYENINRMRKILENGGYTNDVVDVMIFTMLREYTKRKIEYSSYIDMEYFVFYVKMRNNLVGSIVENKKYTAKEFVELVNVDIPILKVVGFDKYRIEYVQELSSAWLEYNALNEYNKGEPYCVPLSIEIDFSDCPKNLDKDIILEFANSEVLYDLYKKWYFKDYECGKVEIYSKMLDICNLNFDNLSTIKDFCNVLYNAKSDVKKMFVTKVLDANTEVKQMLIDLFNVGIFSDTLTVFNILFRL